MLIDPQYAPKVIAKPDAEGMVDADRDRRQGRATSTCSTASRVMRHWHEAERMPFETFLSPDELHMNDWSYGCVAKLLGGAIAEAATRPTLRRPRAAR